MSTINEINTQIQNAMKSGDRDQIKELMKKRKDLMAKSTANIKSTSKRKREREEELCGICQFPLSEPVEGLIKAGKWTASEREKAECFSCATMTDAQYINSTNLDYSCLNSDRNIYSGTRRPGRTRNSFSNHHKFHKACIKKHLLTNDMVDFGFGPQDDLGSYLAKTCPICRDKCITRDLHRGWGHEAYQYKCSHQNCGMVEYFVSPEEARNYPQLDDYRKGLWVKQDNGNWLCKYHSGENNGMSCDAKDVYGTRENTRETFMTSCDYILDGPWNFTQIAGNDDEESTSYITTCPHHKLLFCMENGVDETSCTETYKHFSNGAYRAYREALSNRGMLNFKCLNCNSWYTDKRAIPHSTHWEILCYDCENALSFENLTLEQYGLDNVRFYCAEHINRIRCDRGMLTNNWCRNTRYLCGDEQWNRFVQETEATENNESYWMVDRDSRFFCPEHRRRTGQRNATWRNPHNVEQFGGMTNEGYTFISWDHEQETIQNLLSAEESLENLMEIKYILEVGKARALHEQQLGEGLDSDDEIGTTTYLNFLAAKITYYDTYLQKINRNIYRFNSKGGGKRKKKSKKNIRMRKKTRRKRGANKNDDLKKAYGQRRKDGATQREIQSEYIKTLDRNTPYVRTSKSTKNPLTFSQKNCKSDRDCKSNEICSGGNEKNEGVCVKPVIKYTGELHYDNPRQKRLASLTPLDDYKGWYYNNQTDTYMQYDLKRKKFLSKSKKHPSDIKKQRAMASLKRKYTRKFGKKAGKRKKKTRRRRKKKTRRRRKKKR